MYYSLHTKDQAQTEKTLYKDYLTFLRVPMGISLGKDKSLSLRFLLAVGRPGGPAWHKGRVPYSESKDGAGMKSGLLVLWVKPDWLNQAGLF